MVIYLTQTVEHVTDLDEAEPDVVFGQLLVLLRVEGRGRDALQLVVVHQPVDEPVVVRLTGCVRAQVDLTLVCRRKAAGRATEE